jgi:hypothetical protein
MTVVQAGEVLQIGRSKTYELTVEWERSGGRSGLAFVWPPETSPPYSPRPLRRRRPR